MPTCPCAGPPCWWVGPSLAGAGFRQAHRAAVLILYLGVGWEGLGPSALCGPWLCSWSSARLGLSDMGPVGGCLACGPLPSGPSPGQACGPGSRTPGWFRVVWGWGGSCQVCAPSHRWHLAFHRQRAHPGLCSLAEHGQPHAGLVKRYADPHPAPLSRVVFQVSLLKLAAVESWLYLALRLGHLTCVPHSSPTWMPLLSDVSSAPWEQPSLLHHP